MNYLVIKNNDIVAILTDIDALFDWLKVSITPQGFVYIDGKQCSFSYNINDYTPEQIKQNLINYHLKTIEVISQVGIYKLERI